MNNQCAGIFGWLFGHKYVKSTLTATHTWNHCWRCGRVAGD